MKKILSIIALASLAISAIAQDTETPVKKTYEVKSAMLKSVNKVMGQTIEAIAYFDDFGAKQMSKVKTSVPGGGEAEIVTIQKDGKSYMVNMAAKMVQELPVQESINYLDLTDEIVKKYNINNVGTEKIGDWDCTKYTEEISTQMGQPANLTVWVWKGIPMKSVTSIAGMEMVTEVVEFDENAFILPETFEVPEFK